MLVTLVLIGCGLLGCTATPETEDQANSYVLGDWSESHKLGGFTSKSWLTVSSDGTYAMDSKWESKKRERSESGTWKVSTFVDVTKSGKPVDRWQIVLTPDEGLWPESSRKAGALRDGEIQFRFGSFKK